LADDVIGSSVSKPVFAHSPQTMDLPVDESEQSSTPSVSPISPGT